MKKPLAGLLFLALGALYALHQDLWLWDDPTLWLGLPAGLTYHVLYCLAAAGLMGLVIRHAWPEGLDTSEGLDPEKGAE